MQSGGGLVAPELLLSLLPRTLYILFHFTSVAVAQLMQLPVLPSPPSNLSSLGSLTWRAHPVCGAEDGDDGRHRCGTQHRRWLNDQPAHHLSDLSSGQCLLAARGSASAGSREDGKTGRRTVPSPASSSSSSRAAASRRLLPAVAAAAGHSA